MPAKPVDPKQAAKPSTPEPPANPDGQPRHRKKRKNNWSGVRPWIGNFAILALIGFEYYFISNGFKSTDDNGWGWPISILVPMAGIVAFFGILFISNIYSTNPDLSHGEMRKAITASILVVYIFFIQTVLFSSASPIYRLNAGATASPTGSASAEPAYPATPQSKSGPVVVALQQATATPTVTETPTPQGEEPPAPGEEPSPEPTLTEATATAPPTTINTPLELAASITNAFTALVGTVIGFYFVTRSFDSYTTRLMKAKYPQAMKDEDEEED